MTDTSYATARFNMVEQQVRPWDVIDRRVLDVMETLPRENFVSDEYKGLAYADIAIPLDADNHMLKPTLVGRILQSLNIKPTDSILEIGTGSGYLTACLSQLGQSVTSIEIDAEIASAAAENLASVDVKNVNLIVGDAMHQIPDNAPFDVIAVTGAIADCQNILPKELNDGGRLFMVTGEKPVMTAELITRISGENFKHEALFETEIETLQNTPAREAFVF